MVIGCAVTAQLICIFVFAYAKGRFSHDAAFFFHLDFCTISMETTLYCKYIENKFWHYMNFILFYSHLIAIKIIPEDLLNLNHAMDKNIYCSTKV